jgi:hypothetical protein
MKNTFARMILVMLLLLAIAPLSAEKPQLHFVTSVEHWLGLRHVLEPGDMVVSLAAAQPQQGKTGRGTPPWQENRPGREMLALDRIDRQGIVKGIVFFTLEDFRSQLARIPRSVSWVFFRSAAGDVSPADRARVRYAVEQFARAAHQGGWKVMWLPDEDLIGRSAGELLKAARFVDGIQVSLPAFAGNRDALAFARETRRRIDLVRSFNPDCRVALEIGPEILASEPAARALIDLAVHVDIVSFWAVADGMAALRLIQRLR